MVAAQAALTEAEARYVQAARAADTVRRATAPTGRLRPRGRPHARTVVLQQNIFPTKSPERRKTVNTKFANSRHRRPSCKGTASSNL